MHMAGSILPSEDWQTCEPIEFAGGILRVVRVMERETYALTWAAAGAAPVNLAAHPNGHSCRSLAERMAKEEGAPSAEPYRSAEAQRDYILKCGGYAVPAETLAAVIMSGATFVESNFWERVGA